MDKVQKAIEISDAKIQFISLVDKAANKRQFLVTKQEGGSAQFSTTAKIVKVDAATHYITGIVYEPLAEDAHGNFMTEEEIRRLSVRAKPTIPAIWPSTTMSSMCSRPSILRVRGPALTRKPCTPRLTLIF